MTSTTLADIRAARATLTLLDPAGNTALHELITRRGPVDALAWLNASDATSHERVIYLGGMAAEELQARAAALREATRRAGARVLIPEDDRWPARLDDLADVAFPHARSAALCLWVRGPGAEHLQHMLAVTGSRAATTYGIHVTNEIAIGATDAGWTIAATSGYGIDTAALRAALSVDGHPVAVLPGGIERFYPAGNSALLDQIAARGLLVSAFPPGAIPTRLRLERTAGLLAAMTAGTVVVESARRGTALRTLDEALRRGRAAMVVPGPVTSVQSAGLHHAAREDRRIRLVGGSRDILADVAAEPEQK